MVDVGVGRQLNSCSFHLGQFHIFGISQLRLVLNWWVLVLRVNHITIVLLRISFLWSNCMNYVNLLVPVFLIFNLINQKRRIIWRYDIVRVIKPWIQLRFIVHILLRNFINKRPILYECSIQNLLLILKSDQVWIISYATLKFRTIGFILERLQFGPAFLLHRTTLVILV